MTLSTCTTFLKSEWQREVLSDRSNTRGLPGLALANNLFRSKCYFSFIFCTDNECRSKLMDVLLLCNM